MANKFQVKRTSISGRTPNTTNSGNTHYIDTGEFALNMADGILYSSNGSAVIEIGSNTTTQRITNALIVNNDKRINFNTVNTSVSAHFVQQNDDNFVFYTTNTAYGQRPVWSIYANSITSAFSIATPTTFSGNINLGQVSVTANGATGIAGQVLTSNGSATYWGTATAVATVNTAAQFAWTNTHSFSANVSLTGNGIGIASGTGAIYLGGISDANWRIGRNTGAVTKWRYTNNTIDIVTANSNLEGMSIGLVNGNTYFETGYLGTYISSNVTVGNTSVNATINSTAFSGTANNSTNLGGVAAASYVQNTDSRTLSGNLVISGAYFNPSANTIQLGNSTQRWVLSANTGSFSGAVSGITTLATGNTTITGFANASVSVNSALLTVGTSFIANTTGAYHTGNINAASYTTTGVTANVTGVYPTTNTSGSALGTSTQRWIVNANTINASGLITASAGANIQGTANLVDVNISGNLTVSGTTTYVNTTNLNVGDNIVTLNADLTNLTAPTENAGLEINRGSSANVNFLWNETSDSWTLGNTDITGYANASVSVNSALLTVGTSFIANTAGAYHTGTVNAASHTTSGITANTSGVYPSSNTVGTALGTTTNRWNLTANAAGFTGQVSIADTWDTADGTGALYFDAATGNRIDWNINGVAAPAVTTRSAGTKLVLYPAVAAASVDFGLGIETNHMWFSAADTGDGFKWYANTIQLAVANTSGFTLGSGGIFPTSNSTATSLGSATQRWVLNANTGSFAGAVSGITALAAGNTTLTGTLSTGNTTITGFANVTSTIQGGSSLTIAGALSGVTTAAMGNTTITGFANVTSTIQGGSSLTIAGAASGITTLAAGNTTVTGFANATVSVNSALLTVGTSFIANTTGAYHTGLVNAASLDIGGSGFIANSTAIVLAEPVTANGTTGTAGQVLSSNGTAGSPYWSTVVSATVTIVDDTTTNGTRYIAFANQTSGTLSSAYVDSTGLTFNPSTGTVAAAIFSATSDERLKSNIEIVSDPVEKIKSLKGVNFTYMASNTQSIGVIAQDVEKQMPELVDINSEGYRQVNYNGIIGVLIEAVKQQQSEIDELKQIIKRLK